MLWQAFRSSSSRVVEYVLADAARLVGSNQQLEQLFTIVACTFSDSARFEALGNEKTTDDWIDYFLEEYMTGLSDQVGLHHLQRLIAMLTVPLQKPLRLLATWSIIRDFTLLQRKIFDRYCCDLPTNEKLLIRDDPSALVQYLSKWTNLSQSTCAENVRDPSPSYGNSSDRTSAILVP